MYYVSYWLRGGQVQLCEIDQELVKTLLDKATSQVNFRDGQMSYVSLGVVCKHSEVESLVRRTPTLQRRKK